MPSPSQALEWTPTIEDLLRTWERVRGSADFAKMPVRRAPISRPMPAVSFYKPNAPATCRVWTARFLIERSAHSGEPIARIVGEIEGTDIRAIVEGPEITQ